MGLAGGKKFTNNGHWEKWLENLVEHQIEKKDKDLKILVAGQPGSAKSSFTLLSQNYMNGEIDWDSLVFHHDEYIEVLTSEKNRIIQYDEARNSFNRKRAMESETKEAQDKNNQQRFRNHIQFINFQNLYDFDRNTLNNQIHILVRCVKQGWFWVYNNPKIQQIEFDEDNQVVEWPEPVFKASFPDPAKAMPKVWEKYKELEEQQDKEKEEEQELSVSQIVELVKKQQDYYTKEWGEKQIVNKSLVEVDFDIGGRKSEKVKAKVEADLGIGKT